MTSVEAVRALVERGGVIWRERWERPTGIKPRAPRLVLLEPRSAIIVWEGGTAPFHPKATDWLATDWKWSPT